MVAQSHIDRAFGAYHPDLVGRGFVGQSAGDDQLREHVAEACGQLLCGAPAEIRDSYEWTMESRSGASGLEAWLQLEAIKAVSGSWTKRPQPDTIVVRIITGQDSTTLTSIADGLRFWLVSAEAVGNLIGFFRLSHWLQVATPEAGPGEWCRHNLVGGQSAEALAKADPVAAMTLALRCFDESDAEMAALLPLPPLLAPANGRQSPRVLGSEALFWAPMRFLLFREWAYLMTGIRPENSATPLSQAQSADSAAFAQWCAADRCSPSSDDARSSMSFGAGAAVGIHAERTRRLRLGIRQVITALTTTGTASAEMAPRLGRVEAQMRSIHLSGLAGMRGGEASVGAFRGLCDEMQALGGLAATAHIWRLGGVADLDSHCSPGWSEVEQWLEKRNNRFAGELEGWDM